MKKIGQRQAQYYRKQNLELMNQLARLKQRWASDWAPGFVNIETIQLEPASFAKVTTARLLGHAVVVVPDSGRGCIMLYADKL